MISMYLQSYKFFLVATSFVHYLIYIATYYHQKTAKISFVAFRRTVIFYKSLALLQMAMIYISNFQFDLISLVLIFAGFGLSYSALAAIGMDQTYFGVELGVCKWNRVSTFPYSFLQHPMIIGNCCGLIGVFKMAGMQSTMPWLVPAHILFYLVHMMQEHYEVYNVPVNVTEKMGEGLLKEE